MEVGRLKYEKPDKYRGEVLLGKWAEKRCSYVKDPHDFRTTYMNSYLPKPFSANSPSLVWDQMLKAQGCGARVLFDHEAPHYLENKSTLYDLSYNHSTKLSDGPLPRELRFRFQRYEPEKDFTKNFGNITSYGLLDYYREKWRCDNQDPRITLRTHYQDTFVAPKKEDLLGPHFAIPMPNSSIMDKTNNIFQGMKLRGNRVNMVPQNELVVYNPSKPRCNPITWECPDAYKEVPDRCVARRRRK